MMIKTVAYVVGLVLLFVPNYCLAQGAASLTISPLFVSVFPGDAVDFMGTLTNDSGVPIYINGDAPNLSGDGLSLDDSAFLTDAPLSLDVGTSYTGPLFSLSVGSDALPGTYTGTFDVVGGSDSSSYDDIASQSFRVTVEQQPANNAVPEPFSIALLSLGLLPLGLIACKRRVT